MTNECIRCGISEDDVKLFDAIYDSSMNLICERCAIIENIPIIKRPNPSQLKESEKRVSLYERMKMAAMPKKETFSRKEQLEKLNKNPKLEIPEKEKLSLIPNFHWEIMRIRRRKGLSTRQLAEIIGESEIAIQMLEKGKIPGDSENLIVKLEQYFQTKFRKNPEEIRKKPVLLDEYGRELEIIPEPKIENHVTEESFESSVEINNNKDALSKIKSNNQIKPSVQNFKPSFRPDNKTITKIAPEIKKPSNSRYLQYREKEKQITTDIKNNSVDIKNVSPYLSQMKDREKVFTEMKETGIDKNENSSFSPHLNDIRVREKVAQNLSGPNSEKEEISQKLEEWNLDKRDLNSITINDLRKIQKKKIEASKQERIEEQKKIEERQKLIEARKEELRLLKEKESKDIDNYLGGTELLDKEDSD